MAVVEYGSLVTDIKGKIAGHVFQRSGQSKSLRTNRYPLKSMSNYAIDNRSKFGQIAVQWKSLTNAQRQSFVDNAPSYPTYDSYGNHINLTGYQLFILINRLCQVGTVPLITTCVTYSAPSHLIQSITAFVTGTSTITWNRVSAIPDRHIVKVFCSDPSHAPSYSTHPKLYYCTYLSYGLPNNSNIYSSIWPQLRIKPIAGQQLYFYFYTINYDTGQYVLDTYQLVQVT
jgi:hypothetical protein